MYFARLALAVFYFLCGELTCQQALPTGAVEYRQALPGRHFQFPRDHFDHPDFRTEWWYYTGNLHARDGRRYGFELVFFRQGQGQGQGQGRHGGPDDNPSAWRVRDLYLAHLALTDIDGRRFHYYKRLNRSGPGLAGASFDQARIWNGNWEARWDRSGDPSKGLVGDGQTLSAVADDIRFTLRLTPRKPLVIHGENGVSQKSAGPGNASYYVSFPRLAVDGTLNGFPVTGSAWMDHEWFTYQLEARQRGWDWFSVQLDSGADLMLFQLRHTDGGIDAFSSGTYIAIDGRGTHLKQSDFHLEALEYWTSPHTGARYPIKWRISVPSLKLTLECNAAIPDQELVADDAATPTYWEGAVTYSGTGRAVGYLEMTGYTRPMRL
jgi:predicted secreted hydrolase